MEFLPSWEGEGGGGPYKVAGGGGRSVVLLLVFSPCQGSAVPPRERAPEPAVCEAPLCVINCRREKARFLELGLVLRQGLLAGVSSELVTLLGIHSLLNKVCGTSSIDYQKSRPF